MRDSSTFHCPENSDMSVKFGEKTLLQHSLCRCANTTQVSFLRARRRWWWSRAGTGKEKAEETRRRPFKPSTTDGTQLAFSEHHLHKCVSPSAFSRAPLPSRHLGGPYGFLSSLQDPSKDRKTSDRGGFLTSVLHSPSRRRMNAT